MGENIHYYSEISWFGTKAIILYAAGLTPLT